MEETNKIDIDGLVAKIKGFLETETDPQAAEAIASVISDPVRVAVQTRESMSGGQTKRYRDWFGIKEAPEAAVVTVGPTARKINQNYVFDPIKLKKLAVWISNVPGYRNIFLVGPPGTGKTSILQEFAARMGLAYGSVSCSGDMRYEALFGRRELVNGTTKYVSTGLAERWQNGGIFVLNELFRMDPGEAMRLVDALDENGILTNPETGEILPRHPMFRLAATSNSGGFGDETGSYVGEKSQSFALRDRFVFLQFDRMTETQEREMLLSAVPALKSVPDVVKNMFAVAKIVRDSFVGNGGGLHVDISPRGLVRWGNTIVAYNSMRNMPAFEESFKDTILNGAPEVTVNTVLDIVKEWLAIPLVNNINNPADNPAQNATS